MSPFAELKRRNVHRAAVFYAGAAWLLIQVATQVFPVFDLPGWTMRLVVTAALVGFPFAMAFSWFYEWTPQGLQRESDIDRSQSVTLQTGKMLDRWIIAVLVLAVVLLLADRFVLRRDASPDRGTSIAVLPLSNESGNVDEQYFSDGLTEDLITALAQFGGLKVISRNSSFQFRDSHEGAQTIGAKLGVVHLLEGSVRRVGNAVRVRAELVSAADGSTLWSQKFDRPYTDLFALQDEITRAVAAALKTRLTTATISGQSDRPPSGSLEAYNAYLEGKFRSMSGNASDVRTAIENYSEAIRIDPTYARAYAALSTSWTNLAQSNLGGAEKQDAYNRAERLAQTALSTDPNLAASHVAWGLFLQSSRQDWPRAEAEYQRALELAPDDAFARFQLGLLLAGRGHVDEAIDITRQLLINDPRRGTGHTFLGKYLLALGRFDEAEKSFNTGRELRPGNPTPYVGLSSVAILRGDAPAAMRWAEQAPASNWRTIAVALATQIGDDRAAADATLKALIAEEGDDSAVQIADAYALRKDAEKVFQWLDRAWATHDSGIGLVMYDPFLQPYRDDPRFAAFCRKVGLPPPSPTAKGA